MEMNGEEETSVGLGGEVISKESLPDGQTSETKTTYKSFKKKYRKMRIKFDDIMRSSNELCLKEKAALDTAKRLAQENDQILEMLLDVNSSAQIPADKRINLNIETPLLTAVPELITTEELARAAEVNSQAGEAIYNEIRTILEEKAAEKAASRPSKSLSNLIGTIPHLTTSSPLVSRDLLASLEPLEGDPNPISYLTPDQIDDYCLELETTLRNPPAVPNAAPASHHQELALRNPHSVYNWLRKHEPKIFLQDGEGSDKSISKSGALRPAGKRASIQAISKADALEALEDDGMGYEPIIGGHEPAKGKRKREDDGGYHPKLGAPDGKSRKARPKKKKIDGSGDGPGIAKEKKGKVKGRLPGENTVVEELIPFSVA